MPRIETYRQRTEPVGPRPPIRVTAAEFGGGQGLETLGKGLSEVGKFVEARAGQAEVSDLQAKMAEAHATFTNKWKEALTKADPGDKELASRFMTEFDDTISQIGDNTTTSEGSSYFKSAAATLRAHFSESTFGGQIELAAVKAKTDYTKATGALSAGVYTDPSSFEMARQMQKTGLQSMVQDGGLPSHAAVELDRQTGTELAKSAIRGWANLNPDKAEADLKAGKWDGYINGEVKDQMFGEVAQAKNAKRVEAERLRAEQERQLKMAQEKTQNDFLVKLDKGALSSKEILNSNLDPFGSGSKEQFIKLLESGASGNIKTDPGTFRELFRRIHLDEGDPQKLSNENDLNPYTIGGKLSFEDLNRLRGEIQGRGTTQGKSEAAMKKAFLDGMKSSITNSNPLLGRLDNRGDQLFHQFQFTVDAEIKRQRDAGKPIMALFDPASPDYLGKHARAFIRTPQEQMADVSKTFGAQTPEAPLTPSGPVAPVSTPTPGVPPGAPISNEKQRKPGETIEQWRARTKGK